MVFKWLPTSQSKCSLEMFWWFLRLSLLPNLVIKLKAYFTEGLQFQSPITGFQPDKQMIVDDGNHFNAGSQICETFGEMWVIEAQLDRKISPGSVSNSPQFQFTTVIIHHGYNSPQFLFTTVIIHHSSYSPLLLFTTVFIYLGCYSRRFLFTTVFIHSG